MLGASSLCSEWSAIPPETTETFVNFRRKPGHERKYSLVSTEYPTKSYQGWVSVLALSVGSSKKKERLMQRGADRIIVQSRDARRLYLWQWACASPTLHAIWSPPSNYSRVEVWQHFFAKSVVASEFRISVILGLCECWLALVGKISPRLWKIIGAACVVAAAMKQHADY
jgi:hypothetical protein